MKKHVFLTLYSTENYLVYATNSKTVRFCEAMEEERHTACHTAAEVFWN
jgi:hypothetical protein